MNSEKQSVDRLLSGQAPHTMTREGPSGQWGTPSADRGPGNLLQVLHEISGCGCMDGSFVKRGGTCKPALFRADEEAVGKASVLTWGKVY